MAALHSDDLEQLAEKQPLVAVMVKE